MSSKLNNPARRGRPRLEDAFAFYVMIEAERRKLGLTLNAFSRGRHAFLEVQHVEDHFSGRRGEYVLQLRKRGDAAIRRKFYRARRDLGLDDGPEDLLAIEARRLTERAISELMAP